MTTRHGGRRRLGGMAAVLMAAALVFPPAAGADDGPLRQRLREWRASNAPAAPGEVRAPITQAGDTTGSVVVDGVTRRYMVHVPKSIDPAVPAPLLLAFHGGGGSMQWQADDARYGLISASERHGFVAVFPNGSSPFPGGRLATWNAGRCCGSARDKGVDDVAYVRAVVAAVQHQLNIDAKRIYATGMSNGGMLVHRLACEAADLFQAVASVAGTDNTLSCAPSRPISVLQIHARDDDHVLFDGGAGPGAFRDESKVTDFTSVPRTIANWTERNGCTAPPLRVLEQPGAYCERHAGCRGGVAVQLCVTETGGHSWPGAGEVRRGKAAASQALSANDMMWDFFSGR